MNKRGLVAALVVVVGLFWVLAEPETPVLRGVLDVSRIPERIALGRSVDVFDDESGVATLADVRGRYASRFRRSEDPEIARGFSSAAVWVRFAIANRSAKPVYWVFDLVEPTLDDVRVHAVHADGRVDTHETGDMRPSAAREVRSNTFAFYRQEPPGAEITYYLRVASQDALRLPLVASRPDAWFAEHEYKSLFAWALYGALLAVSLYYLSVFVTVRQVEYVWCALINLAMLAVLAALYGHVSLYIFPAHPVAANRVLYGGIAIALLGIAVFGRFSLRRIQAHARADVLATRAVRGAALLVAFALLAPKGLAMRGTAAVLLMVCAIGPVLVNVLDTRRFPELMFIKVCWLSLIATVPIYLLRYAAVLPRHPLLDLALPLGILAHGGAMSLGLAYWVAQMRTKVSDMNAELSDNVSHLQAALMQGEEARQRAERATMAKDDFMATMSHELRTPLNAIINIPQGMIDDFEAVGTARCGACDAEYLLDQGEQVDAGTVCEECASKGPWALGSKVLFVGDAGRCLHFLKKIERSGQHLLQMVNGVLDYSKLEAGRFQLTLEPADVEVLCRDAIDQMSELARAREIELVFTPLSKVPGLTCDALRMKQVLLNLLSNAIKFSEPNSVVGVQLYRDGDAAIIEVQDSGIGIAKENQERIFSGFEQVHKGDTRKYGGTGLGLSISRSLVRMHGGELSVRSEVGRGSTFVVRLPRMPKLGSQIDTEMKLFTQRNPAAERSA